MEVSGAWEQGWISLKVEGEMKKECLPSVFPLLSSSMRDLACL